MKALKLSIYEEHLEEASFLYAQRKLALLDAVHDAQDLSGLDARLEAHLDGLVLGGDLALSLCHEHASGDDAGALYAAVSVFCRLQRPDLIESQLQAEDPTDFERSEALGDACGRELTVEYTEHAASWLSVSTGAQAACLAAAAASQGLKIGKELVTAAQRADNNELPLFLRGIGRIQAPGAGMLLYKCMQVGPHAIAREAAVAAFRVADASVASFLRQHVGQQSWPCIALSLTSEPAQWRVIAAHLPSGGDSAVDALLGLGLLGHPACLDLLVQALSDKALAAHAAIALHLITGARILEQHPVTPDPAASDIDRDVPHVHASDPDDDGEAEMQGVAEEEPDSSTTLRLSTDRQEWVAHLRVHGSEISGAGRIRAGRPYHPLATLQMLRENLLPPAARRLLVDELALRHEIFVRDLSEVSVPAAFATFVRAEAQLSAADGRPQSARPSPLLR